jgi:hypothetical protein
MAAHPQFGTAVVMILFDAIDTATAMGKPIRFTHPEIDPAQEAS